MCDAALLPHHVPDADVPVFKVSLPSPLDAESAKSFGKALAPLPADLVHIVGSGRLTHNILKFRGHGGADESFVTEFAAWVRDAVATSDGARLSRTLADAPIRRAPIRPPSICGRA